MGVAFHFLNVGDGDCTFVDFPERVRTQSGEQLAQRLMMVDINHSDAGDYQHVIDYYGSHFRPRSVFRFVVTHPHQDHITGIQRLFERSGIAISNFWDLEHDFQPVKEGPAWDSFKNDWEAYERLRGSKDADGLCVRRYTDTHGAVKFLDEDRITVLSPSADLCKHAHYDDSGAKRDPEAVLLNSMCFVLLIEVNSTKVILAGDADDACWEYIVRTHAREITGVRLLKAAHHGRLSGFYEDAVKVMNPEHIVFSMTQDTEDDFGAAKEYSKAAPGASIYRTHRDDTLVFDCDFDGGVTKL